MKVTIFLNLGPNMTYHPKLNRPFLPNHIKKTLLAPVRLNLRALVALKNLVIFSHETTSLPFIFSRGWLLIISAQNNLCAGPKKGFVVSPPLHIHSSSLLFCRYTFYLRKCNTLWPFFSPFKKSSIKSCF